jgi:hypothetical protein
VVTIASEDYAVSTVSTVKMAAYRFFVKAHPAIDLTAYMDA